MNILTAVKIFFTQLKIGANNSQKRSNIVHPNFIDKVINTYDKDYRKDNKVLATYHNLFVLFSKD